MNYLLNHLVTSSAERTPDQIAVVDRGESMSYGELESTSNQVANLLCELGIERGDRVGLYLDKSIGGVVAAYGAMKAGAAYVPIDPAAPASRVAYVLANCGITHVVSSASKSSDWRTVAAEGADLRHVLTLDEPAALGDLPSGAQLSDRAAIDTQPTTAPSVATIDDDLALILYTSGSTGRPKGVMLSHRNVLTFVEWAVEEFGVRGDDRLSQLAPLHFDLSTFDLFGAALAGASVHLVRRQTVMFPMEVRSFLEKERISVMYAVPSLLTMLVERAKLAPGDLGSLRTVLFAGEVFPTKYLARVMKLLPHAEFANLYGPTETNVCTYYRVPEPPDEADPPISIGRAIANVETFVMTDESTLGRVGEIGELFVRGGTVMRGYWGDPGRTEERLVVDPSPLATGARVYRTGDLVSLEKDGNYTFYGRRDNQIKSRGYRIDLGDVEAAIHAHPDIVEAVVVPVPDELVGNTLKAYVVSTNTLTDAELTRFLRDRLPSYMIPEGWEYPAELPKTSTGKADRTRLTEQALEEGR